MQWQFAGSTGNISALKGTDNMILGMTTSTFTLVHVLISLVGIGSGLIVV